MPNILFVYGNNIDKMTLKIFDCWGGKVFESNSTSIGWDGKLNNKELNSAVFVYYLEFECNERTYFRKGNITLIKKL